MNEKLKELLETDEVYLTDKRDEEELEKRYEMLVLGRQERMIIDDYIACIKSKWARIVELATTLDIGI